MSNSAERWQPNVLLITTYPHGGAGTACRRLQSALQKSDINASLLTQKDVSGRFNFIAERLSFLPWERDKSVRFSFSLANFGTDISHHPLVQRADVIHLHWWNQGFLSLRNLEALGRSGKKIVWTLHDMWAFTGGCHYDWGCGRFSDACGKCPYLRFPSEKDLSNQVWKRKKSLYPAGMEIVTCSKWLAGQARASSLLGNYPITDIPNPIDTEQFKPASPAEKLAFRERFGLAPDTRLILFAAMNIKNPFKEFTYFREALNELKDLENTAVVVVGKSDPADFKGVTLPLVQPGLIQNASEMAAVYAACDVFVIPSLEENLPNTIMESLACGTPVVGFRVGGIPEMTEHGVTGLVSPAKDSHQMARDIRQMLENPEKRAVMGQNARNKVLTEYAEPVIARRYMEVYQG
ncbi:MAG: glycosyltransferase family 4 protein [Bacteroidota bacterium]